MPFEFLQFGFMQRAFLGGIFLAFLLALLGVFVILRKMAFFADGVAHASLVGMAIGLALGMSPLPFAIVASVIIALIIYFFEKKSTISRDTLIGALFTVSMALGVIIISFQSGYQPELVSFLFGNILSITPLDLWIIIPTASIIGLITALSYKKLAAVTLDPEGATIEKTNVTAYELFMYISFALATVLGVKILGVVLVSALIILPTTSAKLLSKSFKSFLVTAVILSELCILFGLTLSYYINTPSGATIVVFGFLVFLFSFLVSKLQKN